MKLLVALALLASLVPVVPALLFTSPVVQEVHAPAFTFAFPNPSIYGKNYSLVAGADGVLCVPATRTYTANEFVWGVYTRCQGGINTAINFYDQSGATGLLIGAPAWTADLYSTILFYQPALERPLQAAPNTGPHTFQTAFPSFFIRYVLPDDTPIAENTQYWNVVNGWVTGKQNVSFYLQQPSYNALFQAQFAVPTFGGFVMYTGQAVWIFIMILCCMKLSVFVQLEGFKASLAQCIFWLCLYASFWGWLTMNFGPMSFWNKLDQRFSVMVHSWPGPPIIGAAVLLSFYFGEIATLTTRPNIPGLSKFKIPAVCIVGLIFLIDFLMGAIQASRVSSVAITYIFQVWSYMFIAVYICVIGFVTWGLASLARSLSGLDQMRRSTITRIIILGALLIFFMLCGIVQWVLFIRNSLFDSNTVQQFCWMLMQWVGGGGMAVALLLSFRVQVQKEIEISKSATSSTSGTSKAGSSSSSSSSANDPVIEL